MKVQIADWLADKFSWSKLSCFSRCPQKAYKQYVLKKKEAPTLSLLWGRAVHEGQEADNLAKVRGDRLPVAKVLDAAIASFDTIGAGDSPVDIDRFRDEHGRQLGKFESSGERAKICPIKGTVEGQFKIELNVLELDGRTRAALVEGYTDVVSLDEYTGARRVIDYKSGKRPVSDKEVETHLQLGLEATGAGAESGQIVNFVSYAKQKPTTKVSAAIENTQARWNRVLAFVSDTIRSFRHCLKTGDFPKCDPGCYWCSPTACAFYGECYPKNYPQQSKFVEVTKIDLSGTLPPADWRKSGAAKADEAKGV